MVGVALCAALAPLSTTGLMISGRAGLTSADMAFALVWAVGIACALGAAYQAKFHRFAALMLLGGAGLVTCVTFVWFSAPDLALTQLGVEIVTTVLLLLGLRWLPKRIEASGRSRTLGEGLAAAPPVGPHDRGRRRRGPVACWPMRP